MSNMAHCRFHNTSLDLYDCVEALEEGSACGDLPDSVTTSQDEIDGLNRLRRYARRIVEMDNEGWFDELPDL